MAERAPPPVVDDLARDGLSCCERLRMPDEQARGVGCEWRGGNPSGPKSEVVGRVGVCEGDASSIPHRPHEDVLLAQRRPQRDGHPRAEVSPE